MQPLLLTSVNVVGVLLSTAGWTQSLHHIALDLYVDYINSRNRFPAPVVSYVRKLNVAFVFRPLQSDYLSVRRCRLRHVSPSINYRSDEIQSVLSLRYRQRFALVSPCRTRSRRSEAMIIVETPLTFSRPRPGPDLISRQSIKHVSLSCSLSRSTWY